MPTLARAPQFSVADAQRLAHDLHGVRGTASPLASERDQNFLIAEGDQRSVLRIANAAEDPAFLEAQNAAMARVAEQTGLSQRAIRTQSGAFLSEARAASGETHLIRLTTYIAGVPAASVRRQSADYRSDLGRAVAGIARALETFDPPAARRELHWDLAHGVDVCQQHLRLVRDARMRALVRGLVTDFEGDVAPILSRLPSSVIHGDANDHNVLVREDGDVWTRGQRVAGIIDFGDMVHSWTVGDLAIAAAYACLGQRDPLSAVADVVRGYAAARPLNDAEYAALFGLVRLRLCMSVCIAAVQTRQRPRDQYLGVSQAAIAMTLPLLAAVHPAVAEATVRIAGGVDGSPRARKVATFLKRNAGKCKPVLGRRLDAATTMPIPLDVASALVSATPAENAEPAISARIFAAMASAGATITFGGYGEARLLYSAPEFHDPQAAPGERRTVHLGVDLFGAAGTPVHAPLAGTVVAAKYNRARLDYGHVVVLQHATPDGVAFHTLYGHLSAGSIRGMKPGRRIKAGQRIGSFGAPKENGGWTPHLHFQVTVDVPDLGADTPGVARPTQRAAWLALCPDPTPLLGLPQSRIPAAAPTIAGTLAARRARLGDNLSVAYRDPVKVVRGHMQYLWDDAGRKYIDAYNNVPHVGHAHPRVVAAAATQMAVLNTNTRYLHDAVLRYADELCATLPSSLSKVFFVNSGSEANELALRLARAQTGARDVIVLDSAYHGITTSLIDLSPYKHGGAGGTGAPDWVHAVSTPDDYRGPYKRNEPGAGAKYAEFVRDAIAASGSIERREPRASSREPRLAAFVAESLPSVGGQIVLPPGYLEAAYAHVRAAGGVCIADEVQTGYGRIGTHFWAFESQGVVPDVVVLGKPIGNGYPIGAVVTTPEIAASFANGMEFFSTFGGSTVAAVVGLEVLRVTQEEGLMAHARAVGDRMLKALRPLVTGSPLVGDVRGSGLMLGVELVRDKATLEPAAAEASFVVNRMREEGILLGTDGPHHNVLKIRPPMPFSRADADELVETLSVVLGEAGGA